MVVIWDFTSIDLCAYLLTRGCTIEGKYTKTLEGKLKTVIQIKGDRNLLSQSIKEFKNNEVVKTIPYDLFQNRKVIVEYLKS